MAFCVATCPKCEKRFRLVWRIGKKKLAPSAVIQLTCPACASSFEQTAVGSVAFSAGRSNLRKSVIVSKRPVMMVFPAPGNASQWRQELMKPYSTRAQI